MRNSLVLIAVCILVGAVAGSVVAMYLADGDELAYFFTSMVENARSGNLQNSFFRVLIPNIAWPLLIFLFGFSVAGIVGVPICVFIKGFLVSYSATAIIRAFGLEGIWLALISMGVPNLLYIPMTLVVSISALRMAARTSARETAGFYFARLAVVTAVFSGIAAYQAFIQPKIITWLVLIT